MAPNESIFLTPLIEFAEANETPAERRLKLFKMQWKCNVDLVFNEYA